MWTDFQVTVSKIKLQISSTHGTPQGTNGFYLKAVRDHRLQGSVVPREPNMGSMAKKKILKEESGELQEGRSFN